MLAVALAIVLLAAGCATPIGNIQTLESRRMQGVPVQTTVISVPCNSRGVQVAHGSVWALSHSMAGMHKTLRIDAKSFHVAELPRAFVAGVPDLLVAEGSLWFSDGLTPVTGRGDLYRVDPDTNQVTATIETVGAPFAIGDGAVWTYNLRTKKVTGIDAKTNQVRWTVSTLGRGERRYFAFGDGSIWQFAHQPEVSTLALVRGQPFPGVVRRIDPQTNKVIAELPVGPYRGSTDIHFVDGAIWVLGERYDHDGGVVTRIDPRTNLVAATIALKSAVGPYTAVSTGPRTPVLWSGGIWVSTFAVASAGGLRSLLMKIDPRTNQVADRIVLSRVGSPLPGQGLASGEGALWALDGCFLFRLAFAN